MKKPKTLIGRIQEAEARARECFANPGLPMCDAYRPLRPRQQVVERGPGLDTDPLTKAALVDWMRGVARADFPPGTVQVIEDPEGEPSIISV